MSAVIETNANLIKANIKRFQNLLETSIDETERQTIQRLLTEEKAKAALNHT